MIRAVCPANYSGIINGNVNPDHISSTTDIPQIKRQILGTTPIDKKILCCHIWTKIYIGTRGSS